MLPQLLVFEAVARHGSLTRAAEEVCLAQPTVSAQLKKLTEAVGSPLIEQVGKRLLLTDSGRALQSSCEELIELLRRTEERLERVNRPERGRLHLSTTTTGSLYIGNLVARFCRSYPQVRVRMEIANRARMSIRARSFVDDLHVVCDPGAEFDADRLLLGSDRYHVYAPAAHRWTDGRLITLAELADEPMVLREPGSDGREVIDQAFAAGVGTHECEPFARLELDSNEAVLQALIDGLGVAPLADRVVALAGPGVAIRQLRVEGFPIRRHWYLCAPSGRAPTAAAVLFQAFVSAHLPSDEPVAGAV